MVFISICSSRETKSFAQPRRVYSRGFDIFYIKIFPGTENVHELISKCKSLNVLVFFARYNVEQTRIVSNFPARKGKKYLSEIAVLCIIGGGKLTA